MVTLNMNPEFSYEILCAAPYAYWLKQQGEKVKVITCKGMSPWYYFCDEIIELHTNRSLDNKTNGVQDLPNTWLHHNSMAVMGRPYNDLNEAEKEYVNGVLDYTKWVAPPYKKQYFDPNIQVPENFIMIQNRYNMEHGLEPVGFYDIESLYNIFSMLTEAGYNVVYKRPKNTEFITDPNEWKSQDIKANVEGIGVITDYQLAEMFDGVYLFEDIAKNISTDYNIAQLKIYGHAQGFICMQGGQTNISSYFDKPVITYVNVSGECRPGFYEGETFYHKLSKARVYPVIDKRDDILKRGYRDYSKIYDFVKQLFL